MPIQTLNFNHSLDNAPLIDVKLKSIKRIRDENYLNNDFNDPFVIVKAMIDTGAPDSIIEKSILEKSNLTLQPMNYPIKLYSFDGSYKELPVFKIGLDLFDSDLMEKEYCIDRCIALGDLTQFTIQGKAIEMLIGRDILKDYIFTYHGTDKTYSISHI